MTLRTSGTALFLVVLGGTGCGYSWQAEVRRHAAVEHACPEGNVRVLQDNGQELARRAVLDVCGDERLYEHRNAGATYEWFDVTNESISGD